MGTKVFYLKTQLSFFLNNTCFFTRQTQYGKHQGSFYRDSLCFLGKKGETNFILWKTKNLHTFISETKCDECMFYLILIMKYCAAVTVIRRLLSSIQGQQAYNHNPCEPPALSSEVKSENKECRGNLLSFLADMKEISSRM